MKRPLSVGILGGLGLWGCLGALPGIGLLLGAFGGALVVGVSAHRMGWLSSDGAVAAAIMLVAIVSMSGLPALLIPAAFFVSSNLLARFRNPLRNHEGQEASEPRNSIQVAANGAIGLACLVLYVWLGAEAFLYAFAGAFSAATADTWATEIGRHSTSFPRLITTMEEVPHGLSGAVTRLGLAASAVGAAFAAVSAIPVLGFDLGVLAVLWLCGFAGSLIDSIAGAKLQARYGGGEPSVWSDNQVGTLVHGYGWVDNDLVNLICTSSGAFLAGVLAFAG